MKIAIHRSVFAATIRLSRPRQVFRVDEPEVVVIQEPPQILRDNKHHRFVDANLAAMHTCYILQLKKMRSIDYSASTRRSSFAPMIPFPDRDYPFVDDSVAGFVVRDFGVADNSVALSLPSILSKQLSPILHSGWE